MEDHVEAVEKELGEPVFIAFSEEAYKTRRNLMVLASVALIYKLSGKKVASFAPLGIKFDTFDAVFVDKAFTFVILYSLAHFFWLSVDAIQEWRIRFTGTRLAYGTAGRTVGEYEDYPNDPRQSSLMTWWTQEVAKIGSFGELGNRLEDKVNQLDALINEHKKAPNANEFMKKTYGLQQELSTLKRQISEVIRIYNSPRILVSMERFETWYRRFSYSQLMRWLLLEWGFPIALGLWALWLVVPFRL